MSDDADEILSWLREERGYPQSDSDEFRSQAKLESRIDRASLHQIGVYDGEVISKILRKAAECGWRPCPPRGSSSGTASEPQAAHPAVDAAQVPVAAAPSSPANKGGRPEIYNWEGLFEPLKKHVDESGFLESYTDLVTWCRDHVKVRSGRRQPKNTDIDSKTVKAAIAKYGLDKIGLRPVEE